MKAFIPALFSLLLPLLSVAQLEIAGATVCDNGAFVLHWGKNEALWQGVPAMLSEKLNEIRLQGKDIKQVQLLGDGSFVVLSGKNNAWWYNIPVGLSNKILELYKAGEEIKQVALCDNGSFVILSGYNGVWWEGIPQTLADKLVEINNQHKEIRQVTLLDDGSWVLLSGKNDTWWYNIPKQLSDKLTELYQTGKDITQICLMHEGKFAVFWKRNHAYWLGLPEQMTRKIIEINKTEGSDETPPAPAAPRGRVFAVVVGVSQYNHVNSLSYCDDDAYRVYAFLKSPEGGALPDDRIAVLVDEDATRDRIVQQLESIFSRATANDLVLFYFSGHGLPGAFIPHDYDGTAPVLEHTTISAIFSRIPAKHKLIVADACYSGSMDRSRAATAQQALTSYYQALDQSQGGSGVALLMSSKADETSIEREGIRQGVFSYYLIQGLKGAADANKNNVVTLNELSTYTSDQTRTYTQAAQTPALNGSGYDPEMPVGIVRK